ncbi:MAG: hypothetical protein JXA09_14550 [Anaerolineae bacterium]|nr:hypothetical protein [Anaerolineae bacterium]
MNLFNKIVVILLILAIMVLIPLALIFPEQAEVVLRAAADIIGANVDWLHGLDTGPQIGMRLLLIAVGLLVFLGGLVLLIFEFVRFRQRGTVKLKDGSGEVTTSGISEHLAYYIDMLPDVAQVKPVVQTSSKGVQVTLNVEIAPGIDALQKSNQIRQTARRVLEDQLGLPVREEIRVVLKPSSFPKLAAGAQMPPVIAEAIGEKPAAEAPAAPAVAAAPSMDWSLEGTEAGAYVDLPEVEQAAEDVQASGEEGADADERREESW